MARAPTTLDPFNAIAEPKRREVLDLLIGGEMPVNGIVKTLGWPQPQVSKHLGVLRQVGLVDVRRSGRQQLYKLNAGQLKPIHDWVRTFERFWTHHLQRIKAVAEAKAKTTHSSQRENPNNRSDSHA
jgi:DNA-binding transcriptional ArsR family regulator